LGYIPHLPDEVLITIVEDFVHLLDKVVCEHQELKIYGIDRLSQKSGLAGFTFKRSDNGRMYASIVARFLA